MEISNERDKMKSFVGIGVGKNNMWLGENGNVRITAGRLYVLVMKNLRTWNVLVAKLAKV